MKSINCRSSVIRTVTNAITEYFVPVPSSCFTTSNYLPIRGTKIIILGDLMQKSLLFLKDRSEKRKKDKRID